MIYFVQPEGGGPIKIGHTQVDMQARHKQLEADFGCKLVVLATMRGGLTQEKKLHARFGRLRLGRTEQFQPAPELLEFIGREAQPDLDHKSVEAMRQKTHNHRLVRLSEEFVHKANVLAAFRHERTADMIERMLGPIIERELAEEVDKELARLADREAS